SIADRRFSIDRLILLFASAGRSRRCVVVQQTPAAVAAGGDVGGLHAGGAVLPVGPQGGGELGAGGPRDGARDPDAQGLVADRPGARVGEDVLPRAPDLRPAVEAVPAGMDAACLFLVEPHQFHRREVARLERPVEGKVRRGNGRFVRAPLHDAAPNAAATRSRSTLPPDTSATTRPPPPAP